MAQRVRMQAVLLALVSALFLTSCSSQDEPSDARASAPCSDQVRGKVQEIIQAQLAAFQGERVTDAYQYFSENFQSDIDKESFAIIAGSNYPMLINSTSIAYGECRDINPGYAQAVVVKAEGRSHKLLYFFAGKVSELSKSLRVEGITIED